MLLSSSINEISVPQDSVGRHTLFWLLEAVDVDEEDELPWLATGRMGGYKVAPISKHLSLHFELVHLFRGSHFSEVGRRGEVRNPAARIHARVPPPYLNSQLSSSNLRVKLDFL